MHEAGILLRILEVARAGIPEDIGDVPVRSVNLKVGKMTGVVPASLQFAFNIVRTGTAFEDATLNVEEVPVEVECPDCRTRFIIEAPRFACERCGGRRLEIIAGRELIVTSVEVGRSSGCKRKG